MTIAVPVAPSAKTPISAASVPCTRASSGVTPSGSTRTTAAVGVGLFEQRADVGARSGRNRWRAGRGAPAAGAGRSRRGSRAAARSRARAGARRRAYGERFSSTEPACDDAFSDLPAPETPDFASTIALSIDAGERAEREQRRGRVAAGVRDQQSLRRVELRQAVAPGARAPCRTRRARGRDRRAGARRRGRPRRAPAGGSNAAASSCVEAEEEHVGAGRGSLGVRHEGRQRSRSSRGSSAERGLPGERVRAERDQLELRVREQAVERLLAGVAGAADDRAAVMPLSSIQLDENYAVMRIVAPGRSQRRSGSSRGRGKADTAVRRAAVVVVQEDRRAAPGHAGAALYSMNANSR